MQRTSATRVASVFLAVMLATAVADGVELTVYSNPTQSAALRAVVAHWERDTGHTVVIRQGPESSSEALAFYRDIFHKATDADPGPDIINIDSVWPAMLADHLLDLRVYINGMEKLHIPSVIENYTVDGRLVAMPLFVDAGVLFYRKDLLDKYNLPLPFTWSRLVDSANKVVTSERAAGNDAIWGLTFQGKAYEGLTCCAMEWIYARDGGTIVDERGVVTVNNPSALRALTEAADWMGTLVPEEVLEMNEEESRRMFL